jgi:outer membrane immunogenic protein
MASVGAIALAGSAFAADLPSRLPPPVYVPPAPIFTWTGFYVGGQIGYAWGTSNTNLGDNFGDYTSFSTNSDGAVGGGHVGYNMQFNQFVIGLEGDVDGSAINNSIYRDPFIGGVLFIPTNVGVSYGLQASIRGRIGYAWDRVLLYATGGVAFARINGDIYTPFGYDSTSNLRTGWTLGAGLEYAVSNNWSLRAEYRYAQFGTSNIYASDAYGPLAGLGAIGAYGSRRINENRVNVGFSYKFDSFPWMAAPPPPPPMVTK